MLCVSCISELFINWVTLLFGMYMSQLTLLIVVGKTLKLNKELGNGARFHHVLVLIIGEFPTHTIRKVVTKCMLKGIVHPRGKKQQSAFQCADGSSFMIRRISNT